MAKYRVTYGCGHEDTVQLFGPTADRDRKLAWMEDHDCPECYRKARAEARDAENRRSADGNQSAGLPALVGSAKQIAWVETIRAGAMTTLDGMRLVPRQFPDDPRWPALLAEVEQRIAAIRTQSSAKWWIDNRDSGWSIALRNEIMLLVKTTFAVEIAAAEAEKTAKAQAEADIRKAELEAERTARQTADDRSEHACKHFSVIRVERRGDDLTIYGEHNHIARGYVSDGEWVVYEIDSLAVNSLLPEATALAARIRALGALEVA